MTLPVTHDHIYPATGRPNATVTLPAQRRFTRPWPQRKRRSENGLR